MYGNTHTEASATGRRTTALREEARAIIHQAVNGGEDDVVIFCGTGATGAIDKLIRLLALDPWDRPVVFIGPYEHHSNELPWRESVADLVTIGQDGAGAVDLAHLEYELRRHADRTVKIGSFSAASNVTGIVTDVDRVTITLHRHGALACWDYAAAGPYLPIDMNAAPPIPDGRLAYKDAVFVSPHKFIGGPGTPGVLVAKRGLFRNAVPSVPGGGTVLWVSPSGHAYHPDPEIREEGGHARASSSRSAPGSCSRSRSRSAPRRSVAASTSSPAARWPRGAPTRGSRSSGSTQLERLPIISFGLRHAGRHAARELRRRSAQRPVRHPGPQRLLLRRPLHPPALRDRRRPVGADAGGRRPTGRWARCSRSLASASTTSSARRCSTTSSTRSTWWRDHGWKLLPLYRFDPATGLWRHRRARPAGPADRSSATRSRAPSRPVWPPRPRASWPASSRRRGGSSPPSRRTHPPTPPVTKR